MTVLFLYVSPHMNIRTQMNCSLYTLILGLNIYNQQVCTNRASGREESVGRGTQQAVYFAPGQQLNSDEKLSERNSKQQSSCLATWHIRNTINYHLYFLLRTD